MNSAGLQPALIVLVVAVPVVVLIRFEVVCLKDVARAEEWEVRYLPKSVWVDVCLLWIPFGGLLYLKYGRNR